MHNVLVTGGSRGIGLAILQYEARSFVPVWQSVTVAFMDLRTIRFTSGLPTMLDRPTMTTYAPFVTTPERLMSSRYSMRGAGKETGLLEHHSADVDGRKAVHILGRVDRRDDGLVIDMAREGKLDKDAVNRRIGIVRPDKGKHFFLSGRSGYAALETGHPGFYARLFLAGDVGDRCRIFAYQNDGKTWLNASLLELNDFRCNFDPNISSNLLAIDNFRRHLSPPVIMPNYYSMND